MENNYISYLVIQIPVRVGAISSRQISIVFGRMEPVENAVNQKLLIRSVI